MEGSQCKALFKNLPWGTVLASIPHLVQKYILGECFWDSNVFFKLQISDWSFPSVEDIRWQCWLDFDYLIFLKMRHLDVVGLIGNSTCYCGSLCSAQLWLVWYSFTFRRHSLIGTHLLPWKRFVEMPRLIKKGLESPMWKKWFRPEKGLRMIRKLDSGLKRWHYLWEETFPY